MAHVPILLQPGVTTQETAELNKTRWSLSKLIRFKDKLLEKRGGWVKFSTTMFTGICRGLKDWRDLAGNFYLAVGTNKRLLVYTISNTYDITPLRDSEDIATPFTTINASRTIKVTDVAHGASVGDGAFVLTPTAIGGLILFGYYEITNVIDADNYEFTAAAPATASVALGGATAAFTTTNLSASVSVSLAKHGYSVGQTYTVYVSTSVGGLTLLGDYVIDTVPTINTLTFTAAATASSTATVSENGGDVRINYLLSPGAEDAEPAQGYGIGGYGEGEYGYGAPSASLEPPRQWFLEPWGEDLLSVPKNGALYVFDVSGGLFNNPSTVVATAPTASVAMFLAMPQRQVVLLGTEDSTIQNLLLIKWCDVDDYTIWKDVGDPVIPNSQAGWYRIPRGAKIIGGIQGPQSGLIWTDLALWTMTYIGPPFYYGFIEVATGCSLSAAKAVGVIGGITMWHSPSGFFMYDGSTVRPVPCDVWDKVFANLNSDQIEKITCGPNSLFREFEWHIPSLDGDGENDVSVKFCLNDGVWDFSPSGSVPRTAWIDKNIWGTPIGAAPDGFLYQHEVGTDADGVAMNSYAESGWMSLDEGEHFVFIERLFPNFLFRGTDATIQITIKMKEFSSDESADNPVTTLGPFSVTSMTNYAIVRGRNRFASIRYESNDLGSFWRQGNTAMNAWADGKR